jgi:hypothetical protein
MSEELKTKLTTLEPEEEKMLFKSYSRIVNGFNISQKIDERSMKNEDPETSKAKWVARIAEKAGLSASALCN